MSSKKILFVCPYPEKVAPSQRLKFEQYYQYFREAGYEVETSALSMKSSEDHYQKGNFLQKAFYTFSGYVSRLRDLLRLRSYDVVYVHLWSRHLDLPFLNGCSVRSPENHLMI
jgi:hypothetical protein